MKKLICFLLTVIMLVGMIPAATLATDDALPFIDVKESAWYYEAVKYCYQNSYINGMTASTFAPGKNLTRAQFIVMLANLDGVDLSAYAEKDSTFSDVRVGSWFHDAITWGAEMSYVAGTGNGKFSPNANVTREQLAAFLYRYAQGTDLNTEAAADLTAFPDSNKISNWAVDSVKWAVGNSIINGITENSVNYIKPKNTATRAQTAVMFKAFDSIAPVQRNGRIVCWGDSLTAGILTDFDDVAEVPYPERVGELLGVESFNYGIGSEVSEQIACRQGAIPFYAYGFTIPADTTPVSIDMVLDEDGTPADIGYYGTAGVNPVEINGVLGNIECDKNISYYTFTRLEAGEEVVVEDMTPVITEGMRNVQEGDVICLWIGSNNNYPAQGVADLIAIQEAMIEHAGTDEFIIISFTAERYIPAWKELNAALEEYWGPTGKYIDVQEYLADPVRLEELGITPTGRDQEFMSQGWIPASLLADDELHLSQQGYDIVAKLVADRILELGYLDD